jgi:hypothetical protein
MLFFGSLLQCHLQLQKGHLTLAKKFKLLLHTKFSLAKDLRQLTIIEYRCPSDSRKKHNKNKAQKSEI